MTVQDAQSPVRSYAPAWQLPAGVGAAMTVRSGGVSTGAYSTNNLGRHVGDDQVAVAANRQALASQLEVSRIAWLEQVHGVRVVRAEAVGETPVSADVSVTRAKNIACAIMVADCVPVLLAALDGSCVAAAHAGWRGLAAGVLEATLKRMDVPASELTAWVGPAICTQHYEVDTVVREAFSGADGNHFDASRPGHFTLDLKQLAAAKLSDAGVRSVTVAPECVHERSDLFYSYRRDGVTGRCAALIWRR